MPILPPCPLTITQLTACAVKVLRKYDILVNEENEMLFGIDYLGIKKGAPRLYYDGGPHAVFLKNEGQTVICDHINPGVRERLLGLKEVLFAEMPPHAEDSDPEIDETYQVEVLACTGVTELADALIQLSEAQQNTKESNC